MQQMTTTCIPHFEVDPAVQGPIGLRGLQIGDIHWGGDTPKDYTKPRQTIQSPRILDKAPETLYKSFEY